MAYTKRIPAIVSAHPTQGTYTDKDGQEKPYESGALFILYYEDGSKLPAYGAYKSCTREALSDIKGQTFPIINPRFFENKFGKVVGIKT